MSWKWWTTLCQVYKVPIFVKFMIAFSATTHNIIFLLEWKFENAVTAHHVATFSWSHYFLVYKWFLASPTDKLFQIICIKLQSYQLFHFDFVCIFIAHRDCWTIHIFGWRFWLVVILLFCQRCVIRGPEAGFDPLPFFFVFLFLQSSYFMTLLLNLVNKLLMLPLAFVSNLL